MVVGTTGPETLAGSGVETFEADIPVQAGDILGYWVPSGQNFLSDCLQDVGSGGAVQSPPQPSEPNVGETLSLPNMTSFALNVSATLVPASARPTTKAQCMNGGWRTFGVFRNQGDCVSFVATHGRNGPSG